MILREIWNHAHGREECIMNISTNNVSYLNSIRTQYNNAINQKNTLSYASTSSLGLSNDQIEISEESMQKFHEMMHEKRMEAFQNAYEENNIADLDVDSMTDDEIKEVLKSFDASIAKYQNDSDSYIDSMTTDELKEKLSGIQKMGSDMASGNKPPMGPPPMGPPPGAPPAGGQMGQMGSAGSQSTDSYETETISKLLELLNNEDDEDTASSNFDSFKQRMYAILSKYTDEE